MKHVWTIPLLLLTIVSVDATSYFSKIKKAIRPAPLSITDVPVFWQLPPTPMRKKHKKTPSQIISQEELDQLKNRKESIGVTFGIEGMEEQQNFEEMMETVRDKVFCIKCRGVVERTHECKKQS